MLVSLAVAVLAAQAPNMVEDPRRSYVSAGEDAIMMMPPATVSGATATRLFWTADGKYLVVQRAKMDLRPEDIAALTSGAPPKPEVAARLAPTYELVAWNVSAQTARTLFSLPSSQGSLSLVKAVPGTSRLLLEFTETRTPLTGTPVRMRSTALLAVDTANLTRLSSLSDDDRGSDYADVSPKQPLGFLRYLPDGSATASVRFFGADGTLGPALPLPRRAGLTFDADGFPGYVLRPEPGEKPDPKAPPRFQRIDPKTGRPGAIRPFAPPGDETPSPSGLLVREVPANGTTPAPTVFLAMKGSDPAEHGIVTTDGTLPTVSPRGDAVAYVHQGSAMVRPLVRVPKVMLDQARRAAERTRVLGQAKQVGLGLIMYASDAEDVLPGRDADLRQKVGPYFPNPSMLDGFTYTFGGGSMATIERPAETELGFIPGPGGRAVVFADGHVKWFPDKP